MVENSFDKIANIDEALSQINDGATIMFGGFGGIGSPPTIIEGMINKNVQNLTLIGNDTGFPNIGIGKLVSRGHASKLIVSHIGSNPVAGQLMTEGKLQIEFSPQGTLAERIRAGGVGLGGVLIDVGIDNDIVSNGKEKIVVDGKEYLLELPLTADVSIVYAKKSDPFGNLIFDKSARNMNPLVAMAGKYTIAEVEEIVPLSELDPEQIITPGIYVDMIVQSKGVNWKWVWE
ncbi:CoA transferase subunit A [Fredinandcohnia quinoae]|uniref:CoA transferase subunit A n=1 Tax=Fredinandcohnia quinoae TaxID=2918902 RepID=A0AAW5E8K6_9BACI|nr:CoA transferase subunit A [Fredinandcohnia sp. SECRCQ15]MCH1626352.1 CoA transferase subunit A [Fredinandcohnia sp. SECRCQ15]